jgi:alcohol dehydrogenase
MPAFVLGRLPRVVFGSGRLESVPAIVATHGRRTLLVTGSRALRASGVLARLEDGFRRHGIETVGRVSISGEPTPDDVDGAVAAHREAQVQVVVACGGGSVLDAGKAIAGLLRTGTSVLDHLEVVGRGLPYPGPAVPLVAVPTTAGTGSEATRNAVISRRGPGGFKRSIRDERLVPADAVVDPDLLAGAPRSLIAANGMDALTQLLEALLATGASPVTNALALDGLAAVRDGLLPWHADPEGPASPAARSRMAYAALLSGICLANAGLGAVHGLASPLGAVSPVPHGVACGALLPATLWANLRALRERAPGSPVLARAAQAGRVLAALDEDATDEEALAWLEATIETWSMRLDLPGLATFGVTESDIPELIREGRAGSMRTNPIDLTDEELTDVLRASL